MYKKKYIEKEGRYLVILIKDNMPNCLPYCFMVPELVDN